MNGRDSKPTHGDTRALGSSSATPMGRPAAPGKRTRTMGLAQRGELPPSAVQLQPSSGASDVTRQHVDNVATMNEWMDVVMRPDIHDAPFHRQSAVQMQGATGQSGTAAANVAVTIEWSSPFGSDLTGKVTLLGSNDKESWTELDTQDVAATHAATFTGATRYKFYQARIKPVDDVEGDDQAVGQFKETLLTSAEVEATATRTVIRGRLELNRWNHENVRQRHAAERIDPNKADNVRARPLFGRTVQVHDLLAPRVERTNQLYVTLPEPTKQEIDTSLFVTGGYAYRNQKGKAGAFSDHSVGTAIDVNYNEDKMQNALMEDKNELAVLNKLIEPVVQTDPAHADFDIWTAKGQDQLAASRVFNERFPRFLADLLGRADDVAALDRASELVEAMETYHLDGMDLPTAQALRDKKVSEIFATITPSVLQRAAKRQTNRTKKQQLKLIAQNWDSLKAWIFGAPVVDEHAGQRDAAGKRLRPENKIAVGMIPLHGTVLQMFLDAGWDWGGDWGTGKRKDYMHFQDESILDQLELDDDE